MAFIYDLADTWNDAGTVFNGIKLNVTDTASNASSLLMDLQVGGSSKFQVAKDGQVLSGRNAVNSPTYSFVGDPDTGWGYRTANTLTAICSGTESLRISATKIDSLTADIGASVGGALYLGSAGAADVYLERDAAGTLAQRNSTNAQTFNLYNTYTNATNYERGFMKWNSNVLEIGTEADGTGTVRDIRILDRTGNAMITSLGSGAGFGYNGSINALMYSNAIRMRNLVQFGWASGTAEGSGFDTSMIRVGAGVIGFRGSAGGSAVNFLEQTAPSAPSANQVTIYAEDDGAGKTRLMALFATGAAQQIAIEP